MKIVVIGIGYVGLPAAACLADFGNQVICIDKNKQKVKLLNEGKIPIYEPGLEAIVQRNIKSGNIKFSDNLKQSLPNAEIVMITVGTPINEKTEHADLTDVKNAVQEVAQGLDHKTIIAIKSTVPCGTSDLLEGLIKNVNPDLNFDLVSIPEFLREGKAVKDFLNPDRIVVGLSSDHPKALIEKLYSPITEKNIPLLFVDRRSAELGKYVANCFLGVKVGFINEIANLCEKVGADVRDIAKIIGADNRIGHRFLDPGPGFGGSCFPKDILELVTTAKEVGSKVEIINAAFTTNALRPKHMVSKIKENLNNSLANKRIALWGLAFKADTDDVRTSPAIEIIQHLKKEASIIACDPKAIDNARKIMPDIEYTEDYLESVKNADALVILTEWKEFRKILPQELKFLMRGNVVVDLRNILNGKAYIQEGFQYVPIGYRI
jgi:UDPglucose 6-dehydrogenase